MSEIRNCKECGKLFQYNGFSKICPKCKRQDVEKFKIVRDYIYENEEATITEIAEETGVNEEKILRYLREGRLEIIGEHSALILECERCGKGIKTGRFCGACAHELEKELKSGFTNTKEIKDRKKDKMYTAERKKRR